ncbi:phosphotransferase [Paenibacillus sp. SYP-B3998]|nr:phosphotransferase [Paenibacillus sp. SYP-B3998]
MNDVVRSDGYLNEDKIVKREILYKGMNGRNVERFYVSESQSYVFKPLTNNEQLGKETWVYEQVLHDFRPIYPSIRASSTSDRPEASWIIFEDLGQLEHRFEEGIVLEVTRQMAYWHSLSIDKWLDAPLKGPKPVIEELVQDLFLKKKHVIEIWTHYYPSPVIIENLFSLLEQSSFSKSRVLSHGDLHLGNYARSNHKVFVLDWEHAHLNTPLWDLYHLVDISHPIFPKVVTNELREKVLDSYVEQFKAHSSNSELDQLAFKKEYYLFSSTFSLWMLLLIHGDLTSGEDKWDKGLLKIQLEETLSNLVQCAERIG